MLKVNDWVQNRSSGNSGFVIGVSMLTGKVTVEFTSTLVGKPIRFTGQPSEQKNFIKLHDFTFPSNDLIDLALDTKDYDWFKKLTE
ncbi:IDEAL domain-containing protein [Bacillus sp. 03113]|uniref:IDEAL domain-containing protein n=1 Tax=Bacillus sp. 03113 TaxID=2578211 RepID=UPI00114320DE|nr:IDEAL domain-containing protein [Bacillus sp. 03113]